MTPAAETADCADRSRKIGRSHIRQRVGRLSQAALLLVPIAIVPLGRPSPAQAETLQTGGPFGPLQGTLDRARQPDAPVVLIVPGSGPVDRDGNSSTGLRSSSYRLLADGLQQDGITTLRIDKRGLFGSTAAIPDPNAVTIADYASDVGGWTSTLRHRTGARCIWLLGHSEGGLVALVVAGQQHDICGLILVAMPGRPLGDVLREQLQGNPANAPILPNALQVLAALEKGERVAATGIDPPLLPLFRPSVQGLMISELAIDPARLLADLRIPVLVVQGDRDLQVSAADAKRLSGARPDIALFIQPDMNHVLKPVSSTDRRSNLSTYGNPDLPLAPGLVERIATFIRHHDDPGVRDPATTDHAR